MKSSVAWNWLLLHAQGEQLLCDLAVLGRWRAGNRPSFLLPAALEVGEQVVMPYIRVFNAVRSFLDLYVPVTDFMRERIGLSLVLLVEVSLVGLLAFAARRRVNLLDVAGCQAVSNYILFEAGIVEAQARAYAVRVVRLVDAKPQWWLRYWICPKDLVETRPGRL